MQREADCPEDSELSAFHGGDLPPADIDRLAAHLEHCTFCDARLQTLEAEGNSVDAAIRSGPPADTRLFPAVGAGTLIAGRYKVIEPIGEGGMGSVYMAQQVEPVRRVVAIKIVKEGMDSRLVLARFEAERQALALMDHPNIARVLDAGMMASGRPFFVMELIRGSSITAYCDNHHLTTRERLALFLAACRAIQHAHQKGIIHRDIKPGNVLVALYDGRPTVKVIDFGVAKAIGQPLTEKTLVTNFGAIVGTLEYMSPEQAQIDQIDVDTRSDVYSLGVLLYEMLTGSTPLESARLGRGALLEMLRLVREEEPPKPSTRLSSSAGLPSIAASRGVEPSRLPALLRGDLDWIAMKALDKDRSRRYETANALARDVERHLADEAVEAGPPTARYRLGKLASRHRAALVGAAAFVVLLLAATTAGTVLAIAADRARADAIGAARREFKARQAAEASEAEVRRTLALVVEAEKRASAARESAQRRLAQVEKALQLIASIFDDLNLIGDNPQGKPLAKVLAERLTKAARQVEDQSIGDVISVAILQFKLANGLISLGEPDPAIELLRKCLRTFDEKLGPNKIEAILARRSLGNAFRQAGRPRDAIAAYEDCYRFAASGLGPEHETTIIARRRLALGYMAAGRPVEAVATFEQIAADAARKEIFAKKPAAAMLPNLTDRINLAEALRRSGRFLEALATSEEIFRNLEASGKLRTNPDDFMVLAARLNRAIAMVDAGRVEGAAREVSDLVEIFARKFYPDHPDVLLARVVLAEVGIGSGLGAIDGIETLKLCGKIGPAHPTTLRCCNAIAAGELAAGRGAATIPEAEKTLGLCEPLGPDHFVTVTARINLAEAYEASGRAAEALPLRQLEVDLVRADPLRRVTIDRFRRAVSPGPPALAETLDALARNAVARDRVPKPS